jgi:hypothetical protein
MLRVGKPVSIEEYWSYGKLNRSLSPLKQGLTVEMLIEIPMGHA